jgi:hypothetical protein
VPSRWPRPKSRPPRQKLPRCLVGFEFRAAKAQAKILTSKIFTVCECHMALNFSRASTALLSSQIWHANSDEYAFSISRESRNGSEPGFVASWRFLHDTRPAITVGGSPFATFVEAEEACELMLMHLSITPGDMTIPTDAGVTSETTPGWTGFWHLWWVAVPRRSMTGRLVRGHVWRRHDGRRWTYMKIRSAYPNNPDGFAR